MHYTEIFFGCEKYFLRGKKKEKKIFLARLSGRLTCEHIVYPCSGVRRRCPQCSNISETAGPIKAKLHAEHPLDGGTKFSIEYM